MPPILASDAVTAGEAREAVSNRALAVWLLILQSLVLLPAGAIEALSQCLPGGSGRRRGFESLMSARNGRQSGRRLGDAGRLSVAVGQFGALDRLEREETLAGARRVHAELTLGRGITVSHATVALLMQRAGLKGLPGNQRRRPRAQVPTAADLVRAARRLKRRSDSKWPIFVPGPSG